MCCCVCLDPRLRGNARSILDLDLNEDGMSIIDSSPNTTHRSRTHAHEQEQGGQSPAPDMLHCMLHAHTHY